MTTAPIKARSLLAAWHAALGESEFTSAEILKRTAGGAQKDPKVRALAESIAALFPRQTVNVKRLGKRLAKYRGLEAEGLRLQGDFDTDTGAWRRWCVVRIPTRAELRAEFDSVSVELAEKYDAIAEKARRGRTTLTADVNAIVAVDKAMAKDRARVAGWLAEAEQAEERKQWRAEQREAAKIPPAPEPVPERSFTIVAPAYGAFASEQDAQRRMKNFVHFTATARVVPWLGGWALRLDTEALEERGRTFDGLYAIAEALMLQVEHHRGTAPPSGDASFWPTVGTPYRGSLAELDPFALIEQERKGRPVIPRGALSFEV